MVGRMVDWEYRDTLLSSRVYQTMEAVLGGDRSFPEPEAKRHHFVPALTLRRFATTSDRRRIMQVELRRGAPRSVPIKEAASRRNLYTLTHEDGTPHKRLEAWLAEVEGFAAQAIDRLLADPTAVSKDDGVSIAFFVGMLLARTPAAEREAEVLADQAMRLKLAIQLADSAGSSTRTGEPEALRLTCLQQLRDGSIAYADEDRVGLRSGFDHLGDDAQLIYQLRWTMLRAHDAHFITSDRGHAMFDPSPPWPWTGNGLNSSPTYGWADRHLFGQTQADLDAVRAAARSNRGRVVRPRPTRNVLTLAAHEGDDQMAAYNRLRGLPYQVVSGGQRLDYRVLEPGENPVDVCLGIAALARERGGTGSLRLESIPRMTGAAQGSRISV